MIKTQGEMVHCQSKANVLTRATKPNFPYFSFILEDICVADLDQKKKERRGIADCMGCRQPDDLLAEVNNMIARRIALKSLHLSAIHISQ